jgi:hypothetical protein
VTTDGSLLYDANNELREMNEGGNNPDRLELPHGAGRQLQLLHEHGQLEPAPTTRC